MDMKKDSRTSCDSISPNEFLLKHGPNHWYHNYPVWNDKEIYTAPHQEACKMRGVNNITYHGLNDVSGATVLDIGAFAGGMSFAFEDMGAKVTSLDIINPYLTGYAAVHYLRNSKARYFQEDIYTLNPEQYGQFDIVWFQGVLYHLKHPLLALERINSVLDTGGLLVGSTCSSEGWPDSKPHPHAPGTGMDPNIERHMGASVAYFRTKGICSWFSPNAALVANWLDISGFAVEKIWCSRKNDREPPVSWVHYYARKVSDPRPEHQEQVAYGEFTENSEEGITNSVPYTPFYNKKDSIKCFEEFDFKENIKMP